MEKISIDKNTRLRVNAFALFIDVDGTRYPQYPKDRIEWVEPTAPPADYSDETYYKTEQDDAPYVIYTPKEPEQLKRLRNSKRKDRMEKLESKQMRALREAILTGDKTKLQKIDDDIAVIRAELEVEDASQNPLP